MSAVFHFAAPSAPLRDVVREHQLIRLRFGPHNAVPVKPYWPRPGVTLAFFLRDRGLAPLTRTGALEGKSRAVLIGQPTDMILRRGGRDFFVYHIVFQPGALHRLTGLPLCEVTDRWVDAEAVLPRSFRQLVDRMEQLDDPDGLIALAEAWLLEVAARASRPVLACDRMAARWLDGGWGRWQRDMTAQEPGTRQLRRQFLARTGIGPRLLVRLARFDQAVRLASREPRLSWLQLAVETGYHDHQHLARDFQEFTGLAPSAFRQLEQGAPERQFGFAEEH
jgi:AraC-like DNA-binding protein